MLRSLTVFGGLFFAVCLSPVAKADITWNFVTLAGGTDHSLGASTYTFTSGGANIVADGFKFDGSATTLYAKNSGSGETGLGLLIDGDHEIGANRSGASATLIALDLSDVFAKLHATTLTYTVAIGSAQAPIFLETVGEPGALCTAGGIYNGSNFCASPTITGTTFSGDVTTTITTSNHWLYVTTAANSDNANYNVVLDSITVVPEPGFIGALSLGLSGLLLSYGRRKRA